MPTMITCWTLCWVLGNKRAIQTKVLEDKVPLNWDALSLLYMAVEEVSNATNCDKSHKGKRTGLEGSSADEKYVR